ncbi:MAG: TetR/AcrR family transcriptional regulator [Proteobacteria bacterium]|nr:TetR/AcrR family transcriptional regulator [Pseudomonadota bacterium]
MTVETQSPLQEARKKAYRQVILDAAERVFADRGFDAAKVQHIADEAGVSVGTIYSVFGSKSELFSDVLTHRLPELLNLTREAAVNASTNLEKLTEGLNAYIVYMLEHPDYLQIHLREHAWGLGPTRATAEQLATWREGLDLEAAILQNAIDEGIVINEDPYRLARCITAVHQVQLWDWVENGMTEPVNKVADRLQQLFKQMFCTNQGQPSK